ncbi:hypothetical protein CO731_00512 [Aminobacter sp. MSH1]|nr:hypothetical protein CO731_00512 [Aminobacter sp. MSH1]
MRPRAGTTIVGTAMGERCCVELRDRLPVGRGEGEVEAGAGRALVLATLFERQLVAAACYTVADGLVVISG